MTLEEIEQMPALLKPYQVRAITGWSDTVLDRLARARTISIWWTPGGHRRYYKNQILRQAGLINHQRQPA